MNQVKTLSILLIALSLLSCRANKQINANNSNNETDMELTNISPIEKVGYQKLNNSHWVSHTEIIIEATPEQVWSVLTDTESYPNWNEIILKIDGKIEDKGEVDVLFKAGPKAKPQLFHNHLYVEVRLPPFFGPLISEFKVFRVSG